MNLKLHIIFVSCLVFLATSFFNCAGKGDGGDGGGGSGGGAAPVTVLSEAPSEDNSAENEVPTVIDTPVVIEDTDNSGDSDGDGQISDDSSDVVPPVVVGVASLESVTVINGSIIIKFQGNFTDVLVSVKDNNGNIIIGAVTVGTGEAIFTPNNPLTAGLLYTVTITIGDQVFVATVMIAVDNICQSNSLFSKVAFQKVGNYNIKDLMVRGKAFLGWTFGNPFKIKMVQVEKGAKVYLTAYGIYDVPGQECQVYFQRWIRTGKPVENYFWETNTGGVSGWIGVNAEDSSIDGDADYSFSKTYLEIKIIDKNGKDITASSKANIIVTPWPQGSSLTGYLIAAAGKHRPFTGMFFAAILAMLGAVTVQSYKRYKASRK